LASDPNAPTSIAAKREAAQQDGFLREVDEALREEQFVDSLRRYGRPLALAIGVGLVALAGYLWWDSSNKAAAADQSERLTLSIDRLEAGAADAAVRDLEPLAKEGSAGSRAAAALTLAAIAQQQGKGEDAAKRYAAIAADSAMPQAYRDLAAIREVAIRFDAMKPDAVVARLKPLAVPGKPFFGSAGELVAMAYLAQGKTDQAGALFAQIGKDEAVTDSLRARARQMASGLGFDGGVEVPAQAPAGAAPAAAVVPN
jgi:hypothetical protein